MRRLALLVMIQLSMAGIGLGCKSEGAGDVVDGSGDAQLVEARTDAGGSARDGVEQILPDGAADSEEAVVADAGKDIAADAAKDFANGPDRPANADTKSEEDSTSVMDSEMDSRGATDTSLASDVVTSLDANGRFDSGQEPGTGSISVGSDGTLQIWTVGDSITEGVNNGYRNRLWEVLRADGYVVNFLGTEVHPYPDTAVCSDANHDGHPGYTIGGIEAEIAAWYAAIARPDVVLLMAGTNDLAWWVADAQSALSSAEEMMTLVDTILAFGGQMRIIVSTIPPMESEVIDEPQIDRAVLGRQFNAALADLVGVHPERGKRLWLADVYSVLELSDLYDGIHPSREAHDKVGDAWLEVLLPLLTE